ncbi:MAG TPA: hypothetical protein VFB73_09430 [Chloroflexota bacterium]|nr:hypothetical protein [Chloroflexota bacterium]
MPRVSGAYAFPIPGGFLYNYFVAAVFALAGPNPAYVYVVQGALLGLGSAVMTLAVASSLPLALRVAYALTLGVYMGIDTFHLTRQLLSENLSLLLLPVGVALALRLRDRPAPGYWAGAGAVWGLAALARPETIPLGPALALLTAGAARSRRLAGPLAAFLLAFALVFSFWPLRNLLVTERLDTSVGAITSYVGTALKPPSDAESGGPDLGAIWRYYSASVLYVMGIPQFIDPVYRVRPHWWLMWGLFAVAVGAMVVRRRIVFSDLVILAVVVLYLGPLLLGAHVYSYGYRSVAPAVPFVLLFSFKGLEVLLQRYRRAQPQRAPAGS